MNKMFVEIKNWKKIVVSAVVLVLVISAVAIGDGTTSAYRWPLDAPTRITSTLGEYRNSHFHNGIDFSTLGQTGRWVRAIDNGRVAEIFYDPKTYGITIILEHPDGMRSWYSHLERIATSIEDKLQTPLYENMHIIPDEDIEVQRGRGIGIAGETGRGPVHLHFTLENSDGEFVNPLGRFEPPLPFNPQPHLEELHFYPLSGNSWVNGKGEPVIVSESGRNNKLELWGKIGVNAVLWNIHPGTSNRSMPQKVVFYKNGELKREINFETISLEKQQKPITSLYNMRLTNLSPTQYTIDLTPYESDGFLKPLEFNVSGDTGQLEIFVLSNNGQRELVEIFDYVVKKPDLLQEQVFNNSFDENKQKELNLDYEWKYNRIKVDVKLEGDWENRPELTVRQDNFAETIALVQTSAGKFTGWWEPDLDRDGWHILVARGHTEDGNHSSRRNVYLQPVRRNKPGAIASPDGRYTVYTSGGGLDFETFVNFEELKAIPEPHNGLKIVDRVWQITPGYFQSKEKLSLSVTISGDIENPQSVGIYEWNSLSNRWEVVSYDQRYNPRMREADIRYFPDAIALMRDTLPPRIRSVDIVESDKMVRIVYSEHESGLVRDGIRIKIDGEPVNYFWNIDRQWFEIPFNEFPAAVDPELEIQLTNRASLTSKWQGRLNLP